MLNIYPIIAGIGIIISIIAAMKKAPFFNYLGILMAIYGGLKCVEFFAPPLPGQVVLMFMATSVFSFLIYFSIKEDQFEAFLRPMKTLLADDDKRILRVLIIYILIPVLAGFITYDKVKPKLAPPATARIVHPEPPTSITYRGEKIKVLGAESPVRNDEANRLEHFEEGKRVYYQNCFYCHGDDLAGNGYIADAFNPRPLPFRGTDTIAQLPEGYVFYRIAKGWTTLPAGSTPWDSSMPAFENLLTAEEVWQVTYFIYAATGNEPRRM
jgi:mono/diheme cytochrome c family protein